MSEYEIGNLTNRASGGAVLKLSVNTSGAVLSYRTIDGSGSGGVFAPVDDGVLASAVSSAVSGAAVSGGWLNSGGVTSLLGSGGYVTSSDAAEIASGAIASGGFVTSSGAAVVASCVTASAAWFEVASAAAVTLDRANGECQKITVSNTVSITGPALNASAGYLRLLVDNANDTDVFVENDCIIESAGKWLVGWFFDGAATRRIKNAVEAQ
ncbi:MAG: hypothetical protein PHI35_06350 [Victivallaceae bacterium]|nr:hypothetical protein [Victivallaceae bacterium]